MRYGAPEPLDLRANGQAMTVSDATVPVGQAAAPAAHPVRFLGADAAYWRLLIRGGFLVLCTLGIYRFWLATDVRRFLWSNTEFAGETFEYIGTARELLLGFLIAIAILVPIYALLFLLTLGPEPIAGLSGVVSFLLLTFFGHYAVYRARRYRLTRTIYRGVRFHQSGSAVRYAICALFWWTLIFLTLGLVYPFAQSRLERFKMRHTFFGDLPGRFEGSGWGLFLRGIVLWLLTIVPVTFGLAATIGSVNWSTVAEASRTDDITGWLERTGLAAATVFGSLTLVWTLLAAAILYPIFQAMVWRWWASGLRFGDIIVTSQLRTSQVFGVYGRFLGFALLFTLAAGLVGAVGAFVFGGLFGGLETVRHEVFATAALVLFYAVVMLGYSTLYQAIVRLGLWRCLTESLDFSSLAALDRVSAAGQASSPVGEGLADALNVGGF
jgi:uncharacterized membrane protein YjgN (DUF898 family)